MKDLMKRLKLMLCVTALSASLGYSQTVPTQSKNVELQKAVLLSDLRTLAVEIPKLDGQLARAMGKAEIADAAWTLDRNWARNLLTDAYELTYLTEEELSHIGPEPPGTSPRPPTAVGRARDQVRKRILSIARRDKSFADHLMADSAAHLTKDDRQMMYAQLTVMALEEGDNQTAIRSIQDNMTIDPSQGMLVQLINRLALKDRSAADKLILQEISQLSTVKLANGRLGQARGDLVLRFLVFPNAFFPDPNNYVPAPGPEVMKAYVRYVVESLTALEETQPGSLPAQRTFLLSAWLPLNQYAPEYKERFMQLETLSRTPGKDASLPTKSNEEIDNDMVPKKQAEALNSPQPNELSIDGMILRGEFETARKLIGKLPDGAQKIQFTEKVNTKEALSLVKQEDLVGAQNVAERFASMNSILEVYPLIVEAYAKTKNQAGADAAVHQAIKQLKSMNSKPTYPGTQFGMPAEHAPTAKERDGMLAVLGKLAQAVLTIDTLLAANLVDEIVVIANASQIDTTQGQTGIDSELFKNLAAKDEVRARSAADSFKDRLRRIVANAAVYQQKAKELQIR